VDNPVGWGVAAARITGLRRAPMGGRAPGKEGQHEFRAAAAAAIFGAPHPAMHAFWISSSEIRTIVTLALAILVLLFSGCASTPGPLRAASGELSPPITTGRVYSLQEVRDQIPSMFFGDDTYAEVNSRWLFTWYGEYRAQLARVGVVNWDTRFDCNRFVDFYTSLAQAYFYRETFHQANAARALAIGPLWYVREGGRARHAVVQALTERGRIFFDPQTGREVQLTPTERSSAYLQVF
jgi:hypothetical protein